MREMAGGGAIGERIDTLKGSRRLWTWVGLISAGGFFEIYDLSLTGPLSAALVHEGIFREAGKGLFGMADQATFVFGTFMGLYIGVLTFAFIGDRVGRKPVFGYSLIWYAVATAIMGFQNDPVGICFWRFVAGIGLGAEAVAIDCYLVELVPARLRGRTFSISMALQYCARPLGAMLAFALVGTVTLGMEGWRWLNFVPVIGAVGFWVLRRNIPESPRWLASRGREDEANTILDRLGTTESGKAISPDTGAPAQIVAVDRRYLVRVTVMMLIYFNLHNIVYFGFSNWTPALLQSQGADLKDSLFYTAGVSLAAPLAPLLMSVFSDRFERKHVIIAGGLASMACGLLFAWSTAPAGWLLFGIGIAVTNAIVAVMNHNYMSEIYPTRSRARWVGSIYSTTRLTAALSGYVIAYFLALGGAKGVFLFLAAIMVVALLTVALLGPRTRNRTFEVLEPEAG